MECGLETSLYVPWENIQLLIGKIDHYYIDIKTLRKEIYKEYTGGELHFVVENLKRVLAYVTDNCITVRVPVIPDYTEMKDVQMTKEQLIKMGVKEIDIFEYQTWI